MNKNLKKYKLKNYILVTFVMFLSFAFIIASVIGLYMQHKMQRDHIFSWMEDYLTGYIESIVLQEDFNDYFDRWLDHVEETGKKDYLDNKRLIKICKSNKDYLTEISIVDNDGIITYSSNADLIDTNIRDHADMAILKGLLDGEKSVNGDMTKNPALSGTEMVYFGRAFNDNDGFLVFGCNEHCYLWELDYQLKISTEDLMIGQTGYYINLGSDMNIDYVTESKSDLIGTAFEDVSLLSETDGEIKNTVTELYGEKCYVGALKTPEYYVVGAYPVVEADQFMLQDNIMFVVLFLLILAAFMVTFFVMLDRMVLREVQKTRDSLMHITEGELDERIDAGGSMEFEDLSTGINETVDKLKDLIRDEEERVKTELLNSKYIQESAVPKVFPENTDFGLYASMNTAEAVGGDFYDFFMRDENTLVMVMADVSGKGMPAALYMMRAKTLIRTHAQQGLPVEEVARETNLKLCENLSAEMFVTAWIGFLDLSSGILSYVHAGHTLPVLIGDEVSFVKQKINTVLGGLKKIKYIRQEITLSVGESIFLYTDGVTEAHDTNGDMYGDDRLLSLIKNGVGEIIGEDGNEYCRRGCEMVLSDVKSFADGAEQYDDITMMWVKYNGK